MSNLRTSNRFSLADGKGLPRFAAMKNFFTSFFATLTAMLVFAVGGLVLFFLLMGAMVAMGEKKPVTVQEGSYVVFDLSANIQDSPLQMDGLEEFAEAFGGESQRRLQLREVTRALASRRQG